MEIYLLRHGMAEETMVSMRDPDRRLTEEGRRALREALERARPWLPAPSLAVSSPFVRAKQTAAIAAEALGYRGQILESAALVPRSSPERVWQEIRAHAAEERLLLVGHEPLWSATYTFLLQTPSLRLELRPGSLGRIDVSPGPRPFGVLRWLLAPP
ncbi:MAG: histidine phosphatase family protein [Acidobacteria bacterium]|nr:histidine phosphatase family protein [Acidobacteriota bacterium]